VSAHYCFQAASVTEWMIFFEFGNFGIETMVVRLHQSNEKFHI
jgi:hypothetical protein